MSNLLGGLIGAALGFAVRAYQYTSALPDGATLDMAGLTGFGMSGALIGAIVGAVFAMIIRTIRK